MFIGIDIYHSPTNTLTILTFIISIHIEVWCWYSRFGEVVNATLVVKSFSP